MIDKLEDNKRRESSIKIGATGKVSALMMKELDIPKGTSNSSVTSTTKPRKSTVPVSISCGVSTRRPQGPQPTRTSSSTASTSCRMSKSSQRMPGTSRRKIDTVHRIPILASEDIPVCRTPNRGKHGEKRSHIVEIVDMNCGNSERAWSNRLKNFGFSRLSD